MSNHTDIKDLLDTLKSKKPVMPGRYSKEGEPARTPIELKSGHLEMAESEPQIEDKELEKFIKVEKNDFELDPKLKKAGLQVVDSSSLHPRHIIKLPITDEEIVEGLDQPLSSSWRWLAEFSRFILKTAHISLKKIHGHVVRVIKR